MKPLEETHPSLKPDYCNVDIVCGDEKLVKRTYYYREESIQKYTVDKDILKKKIKELKDKFFLRLIDGSMETNKTDTVDAHQYIDDVFKELGLEDE